MVNIEVDFYHIRVLKFISMASLSTNSSPNRRNDLTMTWNVCSGSNPSNEISVSSVLLGLDVRPMDSSGTGWVT